MLCGEISFSSSKSVTFSRSAVPESCFFPLFSLSFSTFFSSSAIILYQNYGVDHVFLACVNWFWFPTNSTPQAPEKRTPGEYRQFQLITSIKFHRWDLLLIHYVKILFFHVKKLIHIHTFTLIPDWLKDALVIGGVSLPIQRREQFWKRVKTTSDFDFVECSSITF